MKRSIKPRLTEAQLTADLRAFMAARGLELVEWEGIAIRVPVTVDAMMVYFRPIPRLEVVNADAGSPEEGV